MISKKRYLELKKRRKQLHFNIAYIKGVYMFEAKYSGITFDEKIKLRNRYNQLSEMRKEYTLITELIDSTKHIMKTDMVFRMANLVNKKLYYGV